MVSTLAWLAYSETERRKALDVIALFKERDTRDELGLGAIRDAFADLLFPGTSTIQTRARYFLFIPWTYRKLEEKRISAAQIADRARRDEIVLIHELAESGDPDGTIGIDARETLKRLPSNVYWQGLARLGIRLFPGSQGQYHRALKHYYVMIESSVPNDDPEPVERVPPNWHSGLPPAPSGYPEGASFKLLRREAEYLKERVLASAPGSLLAFLLDEGDPARPTAFPWEYPQVAEFPRVIQEQLEHARCFSEVMHGAALLYNLILAQLKKWAEGEADYTAALARWAAMLRDRGRALDSWNRSRFWEIVLSTGSRIHPAAQRFVEDWVALALGSNRSRLATDSRAQTLIRNRERALKRGQARLGNPRALELWGGASGTAQFNYRWNPVVQTIVSDIQSGLRRRSDA